MRFDGLDAWLDWQMRLHPVRMDLGLERVGVVWASLGHAALPCPVITVAGTNGKGSCVAMIEAVVQAAGYRCGCYTSPHLLRYNERVRIGGEPVSDARLCATFERIDHARGETPLTYFEFGTLAALDLFAREAPDLVVLEVGLGGRLDAVNLIDADVSVVTSIGRDHTAWLGETLDQIALEKAGIFRQGRPAVIGQRDAPAALRDDAMRLGATVLQLGQEFDHRAGEAGWIWSGPEGERYALPPPAMRGVFQQDNAAAAITALAALRERLPLSLAAIRQGLGRARLPGRFQVLPGQPTWIFDVAHNGEASRALASNLKSFAGSGRVRAVMAILSDKEPATILEPLRPLVSHWYLTQSEDARAMPSQTLAQGLEGMLETSERTIGAELGTTLAMARAQCAPGDCLLVTGSFTTVGQALRWLEDHPERD